MEVTAEVVAVDDDADEDDADDAFDPVLPPLDDTVFPRAPVPRDVLVEPFGEEAVEVNDVKSAAAEPPGGKMDSNSLIKGNDFIRFFALAELDAAVDTDVVAEIVLSGDIVLTFRGEVLEMNWLNPDKSKECVL